MAQTQGAKTTLRILRQRGGERREVEDVLAVEEPLEIRLGYTDARRGRLHKSVSITMRTPGHDGELAAGFLFSEGIVTARGQMKDFDERRANVVGVELSPELTLDLARLERHFYTTSSCGVCGKASLEALSLQGCEALDDEGLRLSAESLRALSANLAPHQALFGETGGNHAAALFDARGEILLVREDVGRHNAMDKLIGRLLLDGRLPLREHGILVSGRASFELLQKALMARCPLLAAVGAPSSLAAELAREYDITLVGFLSAKGFNIYNGARRIV